MPGAVTYHGWTYDPWVDDRPACKRFHHAKRGVEVRDVDHSPYEDVSPEAFEAHVKLGFPRRLRAFPWRNAEIIEHAKGMGL